MRKLLINTMLKAKQIKRGIPELDPIVTMYDFQAVGMLIAQPESQAPKCSNTSTLLSKKKTKSNENSHQ
jgi:hypothetical protein